MPSRERLPQNALPFVFSRRENWALESAFAAAPANEASRAAKKMRPEIFPYFLGTTRKTTRRKAGNAAVKTANETSP